MNTKNRVSIGLSYSRCSRGFFRGDGGIRTHVPGLTDNSISSRARYDRFDTSPFNIDCPNIVSILSAGSGHRLVSGLFLPSGTDDIICHTAVELQVFSSLLQNGPKWLQMPVTVHAHASMTFAAALPVVYSHFIFRASMVVSSNRGAPAINASMSSAIFRRSFSGSASGCLFRAASSLSSPKSSSSAFVASGTPSV